MMLENIQPAVYIEVETSGQIRALLVPTVLTEIFVIEKKRLVAVLSWSAGSLLADSEADGVFRPNAVPVNAPGRWVFSRYVVCGAKF